MQKNGPATDEYDYDELVADDGPGIDHLKMLREWEDLAYEYRHGIISRFS